MAWRVPGQAVYTWLLLSGPHQSARDYITAARYACPGDHALPPPVQFARARSLAKPRLLNQRAGEGLVHCHLFPIPARPIRLPDYAWFALSSDCFWLDSNCLLRSGVKVVSAYFVLRNVSHCTQEWLIWLDPICKLASARQKCHDSLTSSSLCPISYYSTPEHSYSLLSYSFLHL